MATEDQLREYLRRATVELTDARRRLAEADEARHEPVAVIGMACRYPGGASVEEYWDLLREGRSGVVEVPASRWDIDEYYNPDRKAGGVYTRHGAFLDDITGWDAEFFGASPQEALRMDPQQRLLMELVWEALENAGTAPSRVAGSRTAVMVGFMDTLQYGRLEAERQGLGVTSDPYFGQGISPSVVAGRVAYHYDLRGPAVTLDTACSSSLVALHLAAQALRRGECDLAVVGGTFLIIRPDTYVQACATSMLSADGRCKTFDSSADGYVMGEGGGLVVLERESAARRNGRRIRALIRGSAVNQDGRSNGLTAPSRGAQVDVIRKALKAARVEPDEVGYIEAHGTGTQLGDAIELAALHDVFGARSAPLRVGAVKTNIGHTQAAAGVAGLIKTVLALEHGVLPPSLHLEEPAGALPEDGTIAPVTAVAAWPGSIAGVSSFGWSGTNAHVVVEAAASGVAVAVEAKASGVAVEVASQSSHMSAATAVASQNTITLPVSAASPAALTAQLERLGAHLSAHPELRLSDVAHTLTVGRSELDYRRALTCADQLAQPHNARRAKGRPKVAFLLPGVGDQYPGLGCDLYRTEPVFADAVDRCLAILAERCDLDLRPLFEAEPAPAPDFASFVGGVGGAGEDSADPMHRAETSHPFQFTVEYALAKLLEHRGIAPDLLVGYSLGEYVAACLADVFTLEDALAVVVERARMIATAPAGRMLAVAADEAAVRAAVDAASAEVDVAALNGPSMTIVSGVADGIDRLARWLAAEGVACRPLRSAHAFHSSLLEPAREKLAAFLDTVPRHAPKTTIVSNRTGAALSAAEATSADYWADHLVSPVCFADAVRHCVGHGVDVFVELGAGQTLGGLTRQNLTGATDVAVLGTLSAAWTGRERSDDAAAFAATCGRLWEIGVPVDWTAANGAGRIITLPGYPFQRRRFWPEGDDQAVPAPSMVGDLCYVPTWRQDPIRTAAGVELPGPLVVFGDSALAEAAEAKGIRVVEVVAGSELRREGRRVVIDRADPAHYREVLAGLEGPVHVVHAWGDYHSLLLCLQAGPIARLVTVTRNAAEVIGGDAHGYEQAAVHGLGRVARFEFSGLAWQGIDLDGDGAQHLLRELAAEPGELTAWRRGRRWIQDWAPLEPPENPEPAWKPDGTYLITGGTRGLGMALARHLVRSGVRKIALVGRTPLDQQPAPSSAAEVLANPQAGPPSSAAEVAANPQARPPSSVAEAETRRLETLADVAALEAAGAEILLLTADTGAPDQLRAALRRCRDHFGALTGVVHAAGRPASGMIQRQSPAEADAVLAPKIAALAPLTELLAWPDPPELLVLYSSAITALGGIGEADYCAANTVLDAFGQATTTSATRVLTVAWGPWQHDAWQAEAMQGVGGGLAEKVRSHRRKYGFSDEGGCAFLDRLVAAGHGSVVAMRQPMVQARAEWSAILDIDSLVGTVAQRAATERFPRPNLRVEYVAARNPVETTVAEVWGAFLGIDGVGVHDPFFDLGGNSLVGMAMIRALESELGVAIAPATLFEHPTVAEFAAALDQAQGGAQSQNELITSGADRGERRRRARSGSRR